MSEANSSYSLVPDEELRVLRVTCAGMLDVPLARTMITEARLSAAEWGFVLLYDLTGVTLSANITEIFEFPKSLEVYREARTISIPVALILPPDRDVGFWQFYVDTATKSGHTVKAFHEPAEALAWLAEVRDER
jgi:hypothetical protein